MTTEIVQTNMVTLEREPNITFTHEFKGFGKCHSACSVKIWTSPDWAFVLLTDLSIGTSVTNAAETIIGEVYAKYLEKQYDRDQCFFMETYDPNEGIDLIIPKWNEDFIEVVDSVTWQHIGKLI